MYALQTAFRAFHHHNEEMHNYEVDLGAANALTLKLGYILLQTTRDNEFYMEVELVCACLKMVNGCCLERRICSFRQVGYTELLPLLIQVLNVPEIPAGSSHALLQALHVIRIYSKLEIAKPYLAHAPNLWNVLIQLVWSLENKNDNNNWIILDKDAELIQLECIGIIKDLTFRTFDNDKVLVYGVKGLVPTLLHFGTKMEARRLREYVAAIWWNLAMSPSVGQEMANNVEILASLQSLMQPQDSVKTRRNAISSIGNLATVPANHEQILSHDDESLVRQLQGVAKTDDDTDTRRRAMRTLRCLCSGEAAHTLRRQQDFCDFLAGVAQNDVDRDTRVQALECMAHVTGDEEAMAEVGETIKTALISAIEHSNDSRLTVDACKPLVHCLSKADRAAGTEAQSRTDFSSTFYAKLATAVSESPNADAHRAVANIVSRVVETTNGFAGKVPSPPFLNLLSALLSSVGTDFEQSQGIAMSTVQSLVDVDTNRRSLAEDEGLLTALVNYAMATSDSGKKDEAKALILKLIPEL